ncbi:hypothetical protein GDO81_010967 [Engystomops pustulosus]|uniref:Uncharacterized protein n=1 Tax=Engystomops pustulosus TaxID=76066 RepID=A0AAV7C4U7_ENGPU|nr:hypothetical protein GDO81_010967 [Engystomops pustulosus]
MWVPSFRPVASAAYKGAICTENANDQETTTVISVLSFLFCPQFVQIPFKGALPSLQVMSICSLRVTTRLIILFVPCAYLHNRYNTGLCFF